jgi:hypothetical protein
MIGGTSGKSRANIWLCRCVIYVMWSGFHFGWFSEDAGKKWSKEKKIEEKSGGD